MLGLLSPRRPLSALTRNLKRSIDSSGCLCIMSRPMPRLFLIRHGMNDAVERSYLTNFKFRRNWMVSQWVSSKLLFFVYFYWYLWSSQETRETVCVVIAYAWNYIIDWTNWHSPHRPRRRTNHIQTWHSRRRRQYVSRSTANVLYWWIFFRAHRPKEHLCCLYISSSTLPHDFPLTLWKPTQYPWPCHHRRMPWMGLWVSYLDENLFITWCIVFCSEYEGLLSSEIKQKNDKWDIWKDG